MSTQHFDYLDGWRGLAIALLLIGHYFPVPGINLGAFGVQLFFVLSGLLMARLLFIRKVALRTFYERRIARIVPAAYVFMAVTVAALLLLGLPVNWRETAAAALFVTNYFPGELGNAVMPFGHIWSLSVEEHCYIALSLVAVLSRRTGLSARTAVGLCAALCVAAGCYYTFRYSGRDLTGAFLHTEVAGFGIFISAYLVLALHGKRLPTFHPVAYGALLLLALCTQWWSLPRALHVFGGAAILAVLVNLLAAAPRSVHAVLSLRPLRQLGLWSYSIYLWQQLYYFYGDHAPLPQLLGMTASIALGIASYYAIERPARTYLNARAARSRHGVSRGEASLTQV